MRKQFSAELHCNLFQSETAILSVDLLALAAFSVFNPFSINCINVSINYNLNDNEQALSLCVCKYF